MSYRMKETEIKQQRGTLQLKLQSALSNVIGNSSVTTGEISSEIVLCGLVKIQIRNNVFQFYNSNQNRWYKKQNICIKTTKIFASDTMVYDIAASSDKFQIKNKIFHCVSDTPIWQSLHEFTDSTPIYEFDLTFTLDIAKCNFPPFASLYEDDELADFELCAKDGSVKVHKAVLAGYSPVLRTMLSGPWKETTNGSCDVTDATKETLQHFKDYMYLQVLPVKGIDKLAALASMYMMPDLEEYCTIKLLIKLDESNAANILKLAVKYDMEKLMLAVLYVLKKGSLDIDEMIKKFSTKVKCT